MVVHEKFHRVQAEQHLARAVARGHVQEELQGLRHHLVVIRPVLEVVPNLDKKNKNKKQGRKKSKDGSGKSRGKQNLKTRRKNK